MASPGSAKVCARPAAPKRPESGQRRGNHIAETIEAIDEIERKVGKPVVTSNQGMFGHCLHLAGIDDTIPGFGRLFLEY